MDGNPAFTVHVTAHAFRAAINLNTFRASWFRQFLQKRQQFSVALPTS